MMIDIHRSIELKYMYIFKYIFIFHIYTAVHNDSLPDAKRNRSCAGCSNRSLAYQDHNSGVHFHHNATKTLFIPSVHASKHTKSTESPGLHLCTLFYKTCHDPALIWIREFWNQVRYRCLRKRKEENNVGPKRLLEYNHSGTPIMEFNMKLL